MRVSVHKENQRHSIDFPNGGKKSYSGTLKEELKSIVLGKLEFGYRVKSPLKPILASLDYQDCYAERKGQFFNQTLLKKEIIFNIMLGAINRVCCYGEV